MRGFVGQIGFCLEEVNFLFLLLVVALETRIYDISSESMDVLVLNNYFPC